MFNCFFSKYDKQRNHKKLCFRFFPVLLLLMGVVTPVTSGAVSSAVIAIVYVAADLKMLELYALMYGVGQTALGACLGITRILATL
jgi:Putative transmembrane protein 170